MRNKGQQGVSPRLLQSGVNELGLPHFRERICKECRTALAALGLEMQPNKTFM